MPDLQEVFHVATQKVRPDPGALERQHSRERRRAIRQKVTVYALVAAVVIAAVVIALVEFPGKHQTPANETPSPAATTTSARAEFVGLDGATRALVPSLPSGSVCCLNLSPDGSAIVFVRNGALETMGIDGSGLRTVELPAPLHLPRLGDGYPDWSAPVWAPNGSRIAFEAVRDGNQDIYVMDADGSNVRRLTESPFPDEWAAWSPDGSTIVYDNVGKEQVDPSGFSATQEIFTVSVGGGSPTRLTSNRDDDSQPSYSPDGTQIVFHRGDGLWIMAADGGHAREVRLPGDCCTGFTPRWSPDGTTIVFTRYDPAWRYYAEEWGSLPVVRLYLLDVRSGQVSAVGKTEEASTINAPQWLPTGDGFLVYRVRQ
jgi:hypothetical protein